jgi:uncharacterized protein YfaS (alpha-2-macroglobulin family)
VLLLAAARGVDVPVGGGEAAWDRTAVLNELFDARSRMSAYGQSLLLLALDLAKDTRGAQVAAELAGAAQKKGDLVWWSAPDDPLLGDVVDTSVEATAFAVQALAARDPQHALLEPAVRWLLINRNAGVFWSSTKQTAMALYGLLDFMRARHEVVGDSEVEVFVNGASVGTRAFTPSAMTSPDPVEITAPANAGVNTVRLVKRGAGALYWAAQASYYDVQAAAERTGSRKLALQREYVRLTPIAVENRIVYRESPFNGSAAPGDLLLVRLTAAGAKDWRYLMIEDPLPAGAEPLQNDALYQLESSRRPWWGGWREFRDSRVVFFQQNFDAGRYEYTYILKVVSPGIFRASPARISAMYAPEGTASSTAATLTVVEPRPQAPPPEVPPKGGQP